MSDTPRTDSVFPCELLEKGFSIHGHSWVWGDLYNMTILAGTLERELAAERAAREKAEHDLAIAISNADRAVEVTMAFKAKVARLREALKRAMVVYGAYYGAHHNLECWKNAHAALKDTDG